jgi:hypothetical protein
MGIERRGGKVYYYKKRRWGNKVVSEYVGGGADVIDFAEFIRDINASRRAERAGLERLKTLSKATDASLDELSAEVDQQAERWLEVLGFHQHKGQWRKQRNGSK